MDYKKGDVVRYTGTFLRSICWYTPPINGVVTRVGKPHELSGRVLSVEWSDGTLSRVLMDNVEPCPVARREAGRDGERNIANITV